MTDPPLDSPTSIVVDVSVMFSTKEYTRETLSFPPGATVGRVPCLECGGTGWWGYGPVEEVNGPCVSCRGTGRVWVGLV